MCFQSFPQGPLNNPVVAIISREHLTNAPRSALGAAGGSELHDYIIGQHCEYMLERDGRQLSQSNKQELINSFHIKKRGLDAKHNVPLRERGPSGNKIICCGNDGTSFPLTPRVIRRAFNEAMDKPLKLLAEQLNRCGDLAGYNRPQVIVAGGTARSLALQEKIRTMCQKRKMKAPIFIEKIRKGVRDRCVYPLLSLSRSIVFLLLLFLRSRPYPVCFRA